MNVVRTTTLAIGTSLIGSLLYSVLTEQRNLLQLIILAIGFIFLFHGTGFLQEGIIIILRWYRVKRPVIGIINDLPWRDGWDWAWPKMKPDEWHSKINNAIKEKRINAEVELIEITNPWTRWLLDRYLVIINPYGSVYPEIDIENLTVMKSILHYVYNGGTFVNVADIPFFFPYDSKRKIMYDPAATQATHLYKQLSWMLYQLRQEQGSIRVPHPYPFADTPFSRAVMINIVATTMRMLNLQTRQIEKSGSPISDSLKLKNSSLTLKNVVIHRGIVCAKHVESIVKELEWEREWEKIPFTPLCYIHFGKGKFLISLIFLKYSEQPEDIREKITNLQCDLIIKEVRDPH